MVRTPTLLPLTAQTLHFSPGCRREQRPHCGVQCEQQGQEPQDHTVEPDPSHWPVPTRPGRMPPKLKHGAWGHKESSQQGSQSPSRPLAW